jgi:diguanylate cyclase (GGDEF)-like protein/PAS domain S-box-containing protein
MNLSLWDTFGQVLDGVDIGLCAFDVEDRALAWNRTFLEFFPEHAGRIHAGEPYADNLRRFYAVRLQGDEASRLERYVAEGIERHRAQQRPYEFDHRGRRVRVSSLGLGPLGRVRVWRQVDTAPQAQALAQRSGRDRFEPEASAVLDQIADGVLVVDTANACMWANKAFRSLYGLTTEDDIVGRPFEALYARAWQGRRDAPEYLRGVEILQENRRFAGAPFELALPGGRWVRVVEQQGDRTHGRGYLLHADITAAKRKEEDLRAAQALAHESEARYRLLAEHSSDIIVAVADGVLVYASPSLQTVLGWAPGEVVGTRVASYCHPDDVAHVAEALSLQRAARVEYRARIRRKDGGYAWLESRAQRTAQLDASGAPTVVINVRDITARKALEDEFAVVHKQLEQMAVTDALTGVANRRRFDEALDLELRRAKRAGTPLSLALLDVDHFKSLNDTLGHVSGDRILRHMGLMLADTACRAGDVAARFGRDEFALLLPNTSATAAAAMAQDLRMALLATGALNFAPRPVSISVGVACSDNPRAGGTPEALLRLADQALYDAKRTGRDSVVMA